MRSLCFILVAVLVAATPINAFYLQQSIGTLSSCPVAVWITVNSLGGISTYNGPWDVGFGGTCGGGFGSHVGCTGRYYSSIWKGTYTAKATPHGVRNHYNYDTDINNSYNGGPTCDAGVQLIPTGSCSGTTSIENTSSIRCTFGYCQAEVSGYVSNDIMGFWTSIKPF